MSNHERTRAEIRSFFERVGITFSRIALRFIRVALLKPVRGEPTMPFVVNSQAPFVVSLSNHERARAKIRAFFERPRAKPIPDDRPVPRPALRASASRMFATASCLRSALRFIRATH